MILELEHRTRMPTRIGNQLIRVDDDGTIYAHQNARDPAPGAEWTVDPATARRGAIAEPRDTIERVLRKHGFFELAALHEAPAVQDGVIRTLTYWERDGAARTVTVDRAKVPVFDKLVGKLLGALHLSDIPAS
jgi:hypothetical protein